MGPIAAQKWKIEFEDFGHEIVAERWKLPDGSGLVELSIKVEPGEATAAEDGFIDYLESLGLQVGGDQQTRTRGALALSTMGEGFHQAVTGPPMRPVDVR